MGVPHPVAQAPVGSVTCPDLAATVSAAGDLGSLAVTWRPPDAVARAVRGTRERTDRPFAVNLALDDATTRFPTDDHLDACLDVGAPAVAFSFGDPAPYVGRGVSDGPGGPREAVRGDGQRIGGAGPVTALERSRSVPRRFPASERKAEACLAPTTSHE